MAEIAAWRHCLQAALALMQQTQRMASQRCTLPWQTAGLLPFSAWQLQALTWRHGTVRAGPPRQLAEALGQRDAARLLQQLPPCRHYLGPQAADACPPVQVPLRRARSWAAREEWLAVADFSNQLHSPPYAAMLNCDSWQVGAGRAVVKPCRCRSAALQCLCCMGRLMLDAPHYQPHTIMMSLFLLLPAAFLAACVPLQPPPGQGGVRGRGGGARGRGGGGQGAARLHLLCGAGGAGVPEKLLAHGGGAGG